MTPTRPQGHSSVRVADDFVETSPSAVFAWLLRTVRTANPDPAIHTQFKFGELLGRDGTFVSHVESGRRSIPSGLRDQWLTLIGLDAVALSNYLVATGGRHIVAAERPTGADESSAFRLIDDALEGARLSPGEWTSACSVAGSVRLPRTAHRFCRLAANALANACTPEYQIMLGALQQLPDRLVLDAVREAVDEAPSRGNHAADLLGDVDAAQSGPVLRAYFRSVPDPWMDRGVVASTRKLIARGDMAAIADDPAAVQQVLVDAMPSAASWMTRVELANLARTLGPMPEPLRRRVFNDPDLDVRLAAGSRPDESALTIVKDLRQNAVVATLDRTYGSWVSDPLADKLVGLMMLGRTEPDRVRAAQALSLSPYRDNCVEVLVHALRRTMSGHESRRSACLALASLGSSR